MVKISLGPPRLRDSTPHFCTAITLTLSVCLTVFNISQCVCDYPPDSDLSLTWLNKQIVPNPSRMVAGRRCLWKFHAHHGKTRERVARSSTDAGCRRGDYSGVACGRTRSSHCDVDRLNSRDARPFGPSWMAPTDSRVLDPSKWKHEWAREVHAEQWY